MRLSTWHKVAAGLSSASLSLLVIGAVVCRSATALSEAADRLERSHRIFEGLETALSETNNLEAARLGYITAGQRRFLESYYAAIKNLDQQIPGLRKLTADNPSQQRRLDTLAASIGAQVALAGELLDLHRRKGHEAVAQALRAAEAEGPIGDIRKNIEAMKSSEHDSVTGSQGKLTTTAQQIVLVTVGGLSLVFLLFSLSGFLISRELIVPVRKLLEDTRRRGAGSFQDSPRVQAADQIGELAATFNRLTEDLQASRTQFAVLTSVLDTLGTGVILADENGKLLALNRAAVQTFGSGQTQTTASEWEKRCAWYLPDGVTACPRNELPPARALRGEAMDAVETFLRHPEAPEGKWVSVTARPLEHPDTRLHGALLVLSDIAEYKNTAKALRHSMHLLRIILETLPVAVWVTNNEGSIIMKNKAAEGIWPGAEYPGIDQFGEYKACWRSTGKSMDAHEWPLAHALTHGEALVGEVLDIECLDGTRKTIVDSAVPIWDNSRQIVGAIVVHEDITELRREEEKVKRLNEELKRRAIEVDAVNKELEAFSHSVSHDLRAPLRGIDGFSRALLEDYAGKLDAQGQDYLQRVCAASGRMSRLIDDLLELARVTRTEIRRTQVDMSALAQTIAAELKKHSPERQVEFVITPGMVVEADPQLLRIVLENLLGNAFKFTQKQPRAAIEMGLAQDQGKTVYFVRDNGVGFDMTYAGKLFGAFQRLHAVTEFEGTGVGLASVQRIIQRHGGTVSAQGAVGRGATFYFTLT